MAQHPFHDVAVVGIHNTRQARVLEGYDDRSISMEAALGAIADAGLEPRDIDGVIGPYGNDFLYQARIGPACALSEPHRSNRSSVSPTWRRLPSCRRWRPVTRSPFT